MARRKICWLAGEGGRAWEAKLRIDHFERDGPLAGKKIKKGAGRTPVDCLVRLSKANVLVQG